MDPIRTPSRDDEIDHYRAGATSCLVCDAPEIVGPWTDYNGQVRCSTCGMTYQIAGNHLKPEYLKLLDLKPEEVAKVYCDTHFRVPIARAYYKETGRKVPYGQYVGAKPWTQDEADHYLLWMHANQERMKPDYNASISWDALEEFKKKIDKEQEDKIKDAAV